VIDDSTRWRRFAVIVVCLSVLLGGWLRLSGLDTKSMTHLEIYVPGIRMPEGLSDPPERLTFRHVLTYTFSSESHPPGFDLFMLPWTRTMGTSLRALRLPSALLGTASIALVYGMGALIGAPVSGAVAAALLAFSGYQVFWSKYARMFALSCFLGLAASVLLLLIVRGSRRQGILVTGYAILILAGLTTHIFFWSLFATHMIWTFGNAWGRLELPDVCRAQLLVAVLGSPLLAFASYQSGVTIAYMSNDVLSYSKDFFSFGFALPSSSVHSGAFPSTVPFTGTALSWAVRGIIGLTGAFLAASGLRHLWRSASNNPIFPERRSRRILWNSSWIAAGSVGLLEIIVFIYMTRYAGSIHRTIKITKFLSVLPLGSAAVALLLDRIWASLPTPGRWKRLVGGDRPLIALLAIGPFVMLGALSLVKPVLNQRGMVFTSPYLLLLLAVGFVSLGRKAWIAVLLPVLALTCAASVASYSPMTADPADYAQLAREVKAEMQASDLLFIKKEWDTTPILYYLSGDQYHLVGRRPEDYALACAQNPTARVWVLLPHDSKGSYAMGRALSDYRPIKVVTALHGKAILFQRTGQVPETPHR
jgi:hypothetical protein